MPMSRLHVRRLLRLDNDRVWSGGCYNVGLALKSSWNESNLVKARKIQCNMIWEGRMQALTSTRTSS